MKKRKLSSLLSISMLLTLLAPGFDVSAASATSSASDFDKKPKLQLSAPALHHPNLSNLKLDSRGKEALRNRLSAESVTTGFHAKAVAVQQSAEHQIVTKPQNFVPESTSSEKTTVIVELQSDPMTVYEANVRKGLTKAKANHRSQIANEQASFSAAAMKAWGVRMNRTFSKVFNGGSLTIPANQVDQLLKLPGVKAVYPSRTYKVAPIKDKGPMMKYSAPHIGVNSYWDSGFDGSGIKVGIIDSGIDYNHPSLKDAFKGGYDFVDNDEDPMETPPDPLDPGAATEHGTHVSGTVAGRGNPDDPNSPTGWVRGVAPGADLYVYRVLGPGGNGTTEDEIAAIERAVEDGLDVINLSMGSSINNQFEPDSIAVNNAVLAGVVVVISNGNNGPLEYTTTTPAAAEMAISVGASTPSGVIESITGISSVTGATYYPMHEMALDTAADSSTLLNRPLELVYVGLGYPSDYDGKDLTGKMALIKRGTLKFVEKIANAKNAGAAAAIIFNQDDEDGYIDPLLSDFPEYIPTFDMKGTDGRALAAALQTAGSGSFTLTNLETLQLPGDELAEFSSRGPSLPGYGIKPDITAPGVAIRSSMPAPNGNYQYAYGVQDGTSMAAPHVAGAAALALDKQPELTPDEVKSLLMNNTVKLEKPDHTRYSVMEQGAGRVDLNAALQAKAIAMVRDVTDATDGGVVTEYHTGTMSFGKIETGVTISRTVDVKEIAGQASSFAVSSVWYGTGAGSLTASAADIQLAPNGAESFEVTLSVPADTPPARYEGEIILSGEAGDLSIPVSVYVANVVSDIQLYPDIFSPNQDSNQDTADISFEVNSENNYMSLDVYDTLTGKWVGMILEEENGLSPGIYGISQWNGIVTDSMGEFVLPDGSYMIIPWYEDAVDSYKIEEEAVSLLIDTDAPESALTGPIEAEGSTGIIRGQIGDDMLIDHFEDYSAINVEAWYKENDNWEYVDGAIESDGSFEIVVPIHLGVNNFEVYVFDMVGNGEIVPAHIVTYTKLPPPESDTTVSAVPSESEVLAGDAFTVDVRFTEVQDLYSAQFSLTHDSKFTKGSTVPSVTMEVYQQQQLPGSGLIVNEEAVALENGLIRTDYVISMTGEINGYSGDGTLATFHYGAGETGEYPFQLSNVRFLNSSGEELDPGTLTGATVKVTQGGGGGPVEYTVTGSIRAQGFADGVDYSAIWYEGEDGKLQVVVEAIDSQGNVAKLGTVSPDGTYTLSVQAGTYTIRVHVPGHSTGSQEVMVEDHVTVNFELSQLAAGDVSGDTAIDLLDLNRVARAFGKSAPWTTKAMGQADINRDGVVNMLDISFILNNFSTGE